VNINPQFANDHRHKQTIFVELIGVLLVFIVVYALCSLFNSAERFQEWAHHYEKTIDIDELIFALPSALLALIWFAKRRVDESRQLTQYNHALLQRLLRIQEDERKSIAQYLHDDLSQYLHTITLHAKDILLDSNSYQAHSAAERITTSAKHAQNMTRRMVHSLRPIDLDEQSLSVALKQLIDCANRLMHEKSKCTHYRLDIIGDIDAFTENTSIALFRIVQEALNNAGKHANATLVQTVIKNADGLLTMTVQDNGIGFDTQKKKAEMPFQIGYGLLGIAERVEALAGKLHVISVPAQGSAITVEIQLST